MTLALNGKVNAKIKYARLAQLAEHLTLNQGVQGSNPWWRITKYRFYSIGYGVGAFFCAKITKPLVILEKSCQCVTRFHVIRLSDLQYVSIYLLSLHPYVPLKS